MERRKKTRPAKNPAGDEESGNGDSTGSGDERNRRPSGDAVAGAAKDSSCRQQALRGHAGNVGTRLGQLLAQLRSSVQQVADERIRVRNLKNEMLTLQDENVQLQMALNRELRKLETLWNETEEKKRPPGMSPPRPAPSGFLPHTVHSQHGAHPAPPAALPANMDDVIYTDVGRNASGFLPHITPWNVNENDIQDFEDFEEDLQQYIYRGSSPIENYIDGYSTLSSHFCFGETAETLGTNPATHEQPFQWQDQHRQQQHPQIEQPEQEQQQAQRRAPRQQQHNVQRQQRQQQQFILQQQRSLFGYSRSRLQEQPAPPRAAFTNEHHDAEQARRADQGRGSQSDGVADSNRRRECDAANLEYEQLPLD